MKIIVKTGNSAVPTKLHLKEPDGRIRKNGATIDDLMLPGALIVPVVSTYSVWFMGSSFGISFQAESIVVVSPGQERDELADFVSSVPLKMIKTGDEQSVDDVKVDGDDDGARAM
jgi:hypothetical protein